MNHTTAVWGVFANPRWALAAALTLHGAGGGWMAYNQSAQDDNTMPLVFDLTALPPESSGGQTPTVPQVKEGVNPETQRQDKTGQGNRDQAGELNALPRVRVDNIKPRYPLAALERKLEGLVVVEAHVGPDGRLSAMRVIQSSGHRLLDQAAFQAVAAWRFNLTGYPVPCLVEIPIRFQLARNSRSF
ncbi:MAG: energy transducer TonB [Deltaproteobacteria bacterium]|nr:energy transducer TonB [Deltaproteobacteria bacterium]